MLYGTRNGVAQELHGVGTDIAMRLRIKIVRWVGQEARRRVLTMSRAKGRQPGKQLIHQSSQSKVQRGRLLQIKRRGSLCSKEAVEGIDELGLPQATRMTSSR